MLNAHNLPKNKFLYLIPVKMWVGYIFCSRNMVETMSFKNEIISSIFLLKKIYPADIFSGSKKKMFMCRLWAFNMWAFSDKR